MKGLVLLAWLAAAIAPAADVGPEVLSAARRGQTKELQTLLANGGNIESADKDGRTPLMLAAEHGHRDAVRMLLERGAKPEVRDRQGFTAYALAVLSTASGRAAVLQLLPHPATARVALEVTWVRDNLYTSCFLPPAQLAQQIAAVQPDMQVAAAIREFPAANGRGVLELVDGGEDAALHIQARPGVSCILQQSVDNVNLLLDVKLTRRKDQASLLDKTFGGGLKGLHAQAVTSPVQYSAVFAGWAKSHAGPIYWAAVEAWLRAP